MVDVPDGIAPYLSLGVDLTKNRDEWSGECPLCGDNGKFSVVESTSVFHCWSCEAKGNSTSFVEQLWAVLDEGTKSYTDLAAERKLQPDTLMQWGFVWNPMNSSWYCPGYNESGVVRNLYRYAATKDGKRRLMGTTGLSQQMYGINLYDSKKKHVMLTEGAWDAMLLWEHLGQCRWENERLVRTASSGNLLVDTSVIGLPGCTSWYPKWGKLLRGKVVTIMFDNDHERVHETTGKAIPSGALGGLRRIISSLAGTPNQPKEVHYVKWGDEQEYFTRELPHGYDITDAFHKR